MIITNNSFDFYTLIIVIIIIVKILTKVGGVEFELGRSGTAL